MSYTAEAVETATRKVVSIEGAPPATRRVHVILAFFAIYVIWGSTYLAIRYAVETIPPLYAAGIRHLIAGSILLFWALAKGIRPTLAQLRASVVIGFFFFLLGHGSLHWAERVVPSGLASLLIAIEPIFVFLLSSMAARRWRLNGLLVAGILLGLAGVGVLVGGVARDSPTPRQSVGSNCPYPWRILLVCGNYLFAEVAPFRESTAAFRALAAFRFGDATTCGNSRRRSQRFSFAQVTVKSWIALAYLILFGSVIAFTAYNWLLGHYSPTLVATHTYVNPVVAVLLGWVYGGEALTLKVALAAAMVIGPVVLVDRGTNKLHRLV